MQSFRITWRHEIYFNADNAEKAKEVWESLDLGKLDQAITEGTINFHQYVEEVSFEDNDYNEIS